MARRKSLVPIEGTSLHEIVMETVVDDQVKSLAHVGVKMWVPTEEEVWSLVTCVEAGADSQHVVVAGEDGEQVEIELAVTHPWDASHALYHDNIGEMADLHEGPLLHLLKRRFRNGEIYTYTGDILISINPYRHIDGPEEDIERPPLNFNFNHQDEPPSLEAITKHVHTQMVESQSGQAMLVSGESGAGKTHAAKIVIHYLAQLSATGRTTAVPSSPTAPAKRRGSLTNIALDTINSEAVDTNTFEGQLEQASPLLEAFGNAKTEMNHNSSRFGRWTKITYKQGTPTIIGAQVEDFLLEKSRVVKHGRNERSYHIFYQLVTACDEELRSVTGLDTNAEAYKYLSGGLLLSPGIDDAESFSETLGAMDVVGFTEEEKTTCLRLLAAILALGNIEIEENDDDHATLVESPAIQLVCSLLGLEEDSLRFALCTRTITVVGEVKEIPLAESQAVDARDAVAKDIYSCLFSYTIAKINGSLTVAGGENAASAGAEVTNQPYIGILDIYGFEIMETNSLEQLLINFANEILQQQFNETVLLSEKALYTNAGITLTDEFDNVLIDDHETIDLIQGQPHGILPTLDEQNKLGPRGNDGAFLAQCDKRNMENAHYSKPRFNRDAFTISHYAGDVAYDAFGFVAKNNDKLQADLSSMLNKSNVPMLSEKFADVQEEGAAKRKLKMSTSLKFCQQMSELMDVLNVSSPYYIRCVRPNSHHSESEFDFTLVQKQLKYFGVMETVRIRRLGYPERKAFAEFYTTYRILLSTYDANMPEPEDYKAACAEILTTIDFAHDAALGHAEVFMKDGFLVRMDEAVQRKIAKSASAFQKVTRAFIARRKYKEQKKAIVAIQRINQVRTAKKEFKQQRNAASKLAGLSRIRQARKQTTQKRSEFLAARKIESVARQLRAKKQAAILKQNKEEAEKKRAEDEEAVRTALQEAVAAAPNNLTALNEAMAMAAELEGFDFKAEATYKDAVQAKADEMARLAAEEEAERLRIEALEEAERTRVLAIKDAEAKADAVRKALAEGAAAAIKSNDLQSIEAAIKLAEGCEELDEATKANDETSAWGGLESEDAYKAAVEARDELTERRIKAATKMQGQARKVRDTARVVAARRARDEENVREVLRKAVATEAEQTEQTAADGTTPDIKNAHSTLMILNDALKLAEEMEGFDCEAEEAYQACKQARDDELARIEAERRRLEEEAVIFHSAATIQALVRRTQQKQTVNFAAHLRFPWRKFLETGELVVLATPVLWHKNTKAGYFGERIGSHKIQLVVTSKPRLLWFEDADGMSHHINPFTLQLIRKFPFVAPHCNVDVDPKQKAIGGIHKKFTLRQPKKSPKTFTDIAGDGSRWADLFAWMNSSALNATPVYETMKGIVAFNLDRGVVNMPIERQGYLEKLAMKSKRNWKSRYFILQGGSLRYYNRDMKATMKWECRFITPEGAANDMDIDLDIMDRSIVTWGLKLNAGKDELVMNAGSQEQRNEWMHAIKEMVSTQPGKYRERMFTTLKSYDSRRPKRATVVRRKTHGSVDMNKAEEAAEEARVAAEDAEVLLQTPSHHKGVFGQGGHGGDFEGLAGEMAGALAAEGAAGGGAAEEADEDSD
mmetsp:Transcript_88068/g.251324  ORF Transcript_88068/g.251324 Transcript_88068/m.251324 type:complete len:1594 (+) Transcript_88068:140-4921(+)